MWIAKDRGMTGPVFGSVGEWIFYLTAGRDTALILRLLQRAGDLFRYVGDPFDRRGSY